ncbi:methyl-accepting chemotaxis protein [Litchfieldia salsa]|uniref:Methyl-accepting chemotaxis protein n=1 Tax=Litchfieldia salsa TaxID=930152 RepID=A0A1H0WC61_9BACI|nr:methyl-accepting chemotaxis protein [Litchfieldia salsa]SDP88257.1 methyl-accepting chemotaxis protein [Litchfieldia salsa]
MKKKQKQKRSFKFGQLSLQKQILLPFLAIIIIAGAVISFVSFKFSEIMVTNELVKSTEEQMVSVNEAFDLFLGNTEKTLNRFSNMPEMSDPRAANDSIVKYFTETKASNSEILEIYIGMEDNGKMIIDPSVQLPEDFDARTRPWYQEAVKNKGEIIWTDPYLDANSNELTVSAAKAVEKNGQFVGVVSVDILLDVLVSLIENVKIGETGYAALLDQSGTYIVHPNEDYVGANASKESYYVEISKGPEHGMVHYEFEGAPKAMGYVKNETTGWVLIGTVYKAEFANKAKDIIFPITVTLIIIIGLAIVASFFIARRIVNPIKALQVAMKDVEEGNLAVKVAINRKDEIGQLSTAFENMLLQMRGMIEKVSKVSLQVTDASQTLVASAEENTAASNEVATTMGQIASGASRQSDLTEESNRVVQLLATNIKNVEEQTLQILEESTSMYTTSEDGMEKVRLLQNQFGRTNEMIDEMVAAIKSLDQRSTNINEIVSTITAIASQTNLLALNAAIEAARAGEHGKGFAVVADEVRKLAEQSEAALRQIAEIVKQMQSETKQTVKLINETSEVMVGQGVAVNETESAFVSIKTKVDANSEMIMKISNAINQMVDQRNMIVEHATGISSISQDTAAGTQEVSASIEETTASMEQLNQLAFELEGFSRELLEELQKFNIEHK